MYLLSMIVWGNLVSFRNPAERLCNSWALPLNKRVGVSACKIRNAGYPRVCTHEIQIFSWWFTGILKRLVSNPWQMYDITSPTHKKTFQTTNFCNLVIGSLLGRGRNLSKKRVAFCEYNHEGIWHCVFCMPIPLRVCLAKALTKRNPFFW